MTQFNTKTNKMQQIIKYQTKQQEKTKKQKTKTNKTSTYQTKIKQQQKNSW